MVVSKGKPLADGQASDAHVCSGAIEFILYVNAHSVCALIQHGK
jgi:hypothetical protein